MTILVQCSECDYEWDESESKVGRNMACPDCGSMIQVERPTRNRATGRSHRPAEASPNTAVALLIGGGVLLIGIIAMLGVRMAMINSDDLTDDNASITSPPAPSERIGSDDSVIAVPLDPPTDSTNTTDAARPTDAVAIPQQTPALSVTHTTDAAGQPPSAGIRSVMNTDRGRELMHAMNDIGLRVTGFPADARGTVTEAVEASVSAAIEECKLGVRPPTIEPLMLIELQLRDTSLVMSAQLIAKDNQQKVKVWERSGTVTELSDQALSAGILPPNLKRDVKTFFTSLRAEFNDARRQFSR